MDKREFIKILGLSGLGLLGGNVFPKNILSAFNASPRFKKGEKMKNWAWIMTDTKPTEDEWKRKFAQMRASGIDAVLPEIYNSSFAFYESKHLPVKEAWLEKLLPIAKAEGLEVHGWMRAMMCNIEEVRQKHRDWFVINRKGESAAIKPAYVSHYKFMCPSHTEVQEFVQETVTELSKIDQLDGVHLDYIRFPDVILAEKLQPKYNIVQDREYPEYDYCYCEVCQSEFKKQTGIDVMKLEDPAASKEWRQFRYDRITNLVNSKLAPVARKHNKPITAAVFPNWEAVRQEWAKWDLDAFLPMLYHGYYGKGVDWIGEVTVKEVKWLNGRAPLYSGVFIPQLNPQELAKAVEVSVSGGAKGVSLFLANSMTDEHWKSFKEAVERS
ncbi:MAG: family 10 glycosylhydrolase [archaeon]